jgi:hypothetical protein
MRFDLQEESQGPVQPRRSAIAGDLDWLGRNGGWVLVAFGLGLIALAVIVADSEAVAVVFAFCGVASVVFGVLLPRLEGSFVFSPTKFAATLSEARRVGVREDLTLEERADLMLRVLGVEGDESRHAKRVSRRERAFRSGLGVRPLPERHYPLPRPDPFNRPAEEGHVHEAHVAFEEHVAAAFEDSGWALEKLGPASPFDFVTTQGDEKNFVTAKLVRRFSAADAKLFVETAEEIMDLQGNERCVLAVNRGALSSQASQALLRPVFLVEVLEVPVEGW